VNFPRDQFKVRYFFYLNADADATLTAAIFDDLLNTIKYLTKPSDLPKDNSKWFEFSRERSFPIDPSKADSDFVKQYTIFVYTVGAKSGRDVHLRSDLTYYLTVSDLL